MNRQTIIEYIAEWFEIEPGEKGTHDLNSYDWQAGCYHGDRWLNLETIVDLIEHICEEEDLYGDEV